MNAERERTSERPRYYSPASKDVATFLKSSEETEGELTLIEIEVAPGGGVFPHFHKTYDEHFEVVEGSLELLVGKQTQTLQAGQRAVAPRNTLHRWSNPTGKPITFLVELRPGSSGFEKALKAGYGLAADGRTFSDGTPKNLYEFAVLLEWSEMKMPGIVGALEPVFHLLARRARRKGVDRELEARYCR